MIRSTFVKQVSLPNEKWKCFGSSNHQYLISCYGRIISCPYNTGGCIHGERGFRLLSPAKDYRGFSSIRINNKAYKIHHLVATLFLPHTKTSRYVIHKDGNKDNNSVTNLMWTDSISNNKAISSILHFSFSLDSFPNEEWKFIKDTDGKYKVSSLGRVMSMKGRPIILSPKVSKDNYVGITIFRKGKRIDTTAHQLVAEAFLGDSQGKEVDHIDGNPLNNSIQNLRWVSHIENMNNPITSARIKKRQSPMKGRLGRKNPLSKPIYAISNSGERIMFEGLQDAARKGFSYGSIQYCLHHPNSSHKGMRWFFLN